MNLNLDLMLGADDAQPGNGPGPGDLINQLVGYTSVVLDLHRGESPMLKPDGTAATADNDQVNQVTLEKGVADCTLMRRTFDTPPIAPDFPRLGVGTGKSIGGAPILQFENDDHRLSFGNAGLQLDQWDPEDVYTETQLTFAILGRALDDIPVGNFRTVFRVDSADRLRLFLPTTGSATLRYNGGATVEVPITSGEPFFLIVHWDGTTASVWNSTATKTNPSGSNPGALGDPAARNLNAQSLAGGTLWDFGVQALYIGNSDGGDAAKHLDRLQALADDWAARIA
jgi:hypothetical protein